MKKSFDAKQISARMAAFAVALYRAGVSPFLPPACRFAPTCSEYAHDAFLAHGFFRGLRLSLSRILRCHPLRKGGFDPVPEHVQ